MLLPVEMIDKGQANLASGCTNLSRLVVVGANELGLLSVAEECLTLQELELHKCSDNVLRGIAACENLQILKLVGHLDGFYCSLVSDIGLTILAQGMDGGWMAALSYSENLKTLRFVSCKRMDPSPGPDEYLGYHPALEWLHLQKCQLRDKKNVRVLFRVCEAVREVMFQDCWGLDNDIFSFASVFRMLTADNRRNVRVLFRVCEAVREVMFQDCWGLDNDIFSFASVFRTVKFLSLEGCSLPTTEGLEFVILSWTELENLSVMSCKNIKDGEVSPASSLIGRKGGKFFKTT
ncbi:hypothetical protein Patl1_27894 [Pistacia atlantica]|uniref:Uncharacterized protein n=1 Tax=Pistacia atlantica TaxID=434234 RepID=A0ACC1BC13_9ROSI|nr:hypothetical protein Patl1_27894 [Pistacia atlantica]